VQKRNKKKAIWGVMLAGGLAGPIGSGIGPTGPP